jgi:hypothetical protein
VWSIAAGLPLRGRSAARRFGPPRARARSSRQYRKPIVVAQEWQSILAAGKYPSRADLARMLGVSRSRVTPVLGVMALTPGVVQALAALGDRLPEPIVTERGLRSLLNRSEPTLLAVAHEPESL